MIEYQKNVDSDSDTIETECQWKEFSNDASFNEFIKTSETGRAPIIVPSEFSLNPSQVSDLTESFNKSLTKVTEDFRRYRVRSEVCRKTLESQIKSKSTSTVTNTSNSSTSDEVEALRNELVGYQEKEEMLRRKCREMEKSISRLKTRAGESTIASEWRVRYENTVAERDELKTKLRDNTDVLALEKLKKEYGVYRKRALAMLEEKEEMLVDAQRKLSEAGIDFDIKTCKRSDLHYKNDATTDTYLKNIVLKYMVSSDIPEVRDHMEKAIATVLKFTPEEIEKVEQKRLGGAVVPSSWTSTIGDVLWG